MALQLEGRTALVTGAGRGQGRAHAVRLAEQGADVVAVDVPGDVDVHVGYEPATPGDLSETASLIKQQGRRCIPLHADVRDTAAIRAAVDECISTFGRLDIVVANAGICTWGRFWEMSEDQWANMIEVNLNGVWRTLKAAAPVMIETGNGGSIIVTASVGAVKGLPGLAHYSAAKHGVLGLAKAAAVELAEYDIRVNAVIPGAVDTVMGRYTEELEKLAAEHPHYLASYQRLPVSVDAASPADISDGVVYLASDLARAVTGVALPIDMGATTV